MSIKNNSLIELTTETALEVFESSEKLQPYLDKVKDEVLTFDHDLTTQSGRKRTASLAAKVAKVKVKLDGLGKDLVSDWKSKAKIVDQSRKFLRDELDELKVIARQPLTDWEAAEAKAEEEKEEVLRLEDIAKEKEFDHEIAVLFDEKFDRQLQEEKDLIAKQKADYEEGLKKQAVEDGRKALAESESRAKQAVIDAEKLAKESAEREQAAIEREKLAIEQAKQDRLDNIELEKKAAKVAETNRLLAIDQKIEADNKAQARLKHEREEAAKREIIAAELAETNRLIAIENAKEVERQNAANKAKLIQELADARARDQGIKADVNNAILKVLVANGLSNGDGVKVITLIAKGQLPNTKITY